MARKRKLEVCVLNIALARQSGQEVPKPDDYHQLMRAAFLAKRQATLRGDRRGLLVEMDRHAKNGRLAGVVATYTDFDVDDSWIDKFSGEAASDSDLEKIHIPPNLRPRHRRYNFQFDLGSHKLVIETKSEPETGSNRVNLSPGTAASLFDQLFQAEPITEQFGAIGVTVLPHQEGIDAITNWKHAEKIEIRITPPNPDDEDLEEHIEQRMSAMNAARWDQNFRARGDDALSPDDELKASMRVAARNGHVIAIGYEEGERRELSTKNMPLLVDRKYDPDLVLHVSAFERTADDAFAMAQGGRVARRARKK